MSVRGVDFRSWNGFHRIAASPFLIKNLFK
jgi:hypothetical protein